MLLDEAELQVSNKLILPEPDVQLQPPKFAKFVAPVESVMSQIDPVQADCGQLSDDPQ